MLTKVMLVSALLASGPIYLVTAQDPVTPKDAVDADAPAIENTLPTEEAVAPPAERPDPNEIARLAAELAAAVERAERAEARAQELSTQLEECMDMLQEDNTRRHRNCAPSRRMMTQFQWMRNHGHDKRAKKALDHFVASVGDNNSNLNRVAWNLMTEKSTAGDFDDLALALCDRMQKRPSDMCHRKTDTVALAKFLNGYVDEAIELQKKAIAKGGRSDDYRRRLRTYEAAKKAACATEPEPAPAPAKKAKPSLHDDDDE